MLDQGASVTAAALSADKYSVTLTTSALTESTEYTLTVSNVRDNAGNPITASTQVMFDSYLTYLTSLNGQRWTGISGTAVSALTSSADYPNNPTDSIEITNGLEIGSRNGNAGWNDSFGDNYGMRVTGVLTAPGTGDFHFFLRSDDASQFFLNTSGPAIPDTAGTPLIREDGCCNAFYEPGTDQSSTTTPVSLVAGQQYGFVVLLKEGGGGDGVAVGMRVVGDSTPAGELASIPEVGPVVSAPTLPPVVTLSGSQITYEGTLQSSTTADGTYDDVAGANSPFDMPLDGEATFYRARW